MAKNKSRRKRQVRFKTNLDFSRTFERVETHERVASHDFTGVRGKELEGKRGDGGSLETLMKNWDPERISLTRTGTVTCQYYEDVLNINEIVSELPEGYAYAHPEYTAVEAIRHALYDLLVPVCGENLTIAIKNTSIPRQHFEELRSKRYFAPTLMKFGAPRYICDCGKEYTSRTWFEKHVASCNRFDSLKDHMVFGSSSPLAKPGTIRVIGQSPYGCVCFDERITWEELKRAVSRQPRIPILLGHPEISRWER